MRKHPKFAIPFHAHSICITESTFQKSDKNDIHCGIHNQWRYHEKSPRRCAYPLYYSGTFSIDDGLQFCSLKKCKIMRFRVLHEEDDFGAVDRLEIEIVP